MPKSAPSNLLLKLRDEAIIADFNRLIDVKESGVSKYSIDFVYMKLSKQFYLTTATIQKIVKGYYNATYFQKNKNKQLNLFQNEV